MTNHKLRIKTRSAVKLLVGILICSGLAIAGFLFLGKDTYFDPGQVMSRQDVIDDLQQLETLIRDQFSYRDLKGVDYRARLEAIGSDINDGITRGDFALRIERFLALFGDGHSRVGSRWVSMEVLCQQFLPFLVGESNGRLVAFREDRSDFINSDYPFLTTLDSRPVQEWIDAASQWVADGSPQFVRFRSIRRLRFVSLLRRELNLPVSDSITVGLENVDQTDRIVPELPLASHKPDYGHWPRLEPIPADLDRLVVGTCVLDDSIGYIHIPDMFNSPAFIGSLVQAMHNFKNTQGLIIDIRGNRGGSRDVLNALLPYFMADDASPKAVNVAAYRLGTRDRREAFAGRYLYPADSNHWSDIELGAVREFAQTFQPMWSLPEGLFSEWHYFLISPNRQEGTYHYDKPTIILQDSLNFSACDIFLGAFKGHPNIRLMGLPSGGGSGGRIKYRLKSSHIAIHLSSMVSFRPNGLLYDGKGIEPDINVYPTPEFFIGRSDNALEEALSLLEIDKAVRTANNGIQPAPRTSGR